MVKKSSQNLIRPSIEYYRPPHMRINNDDLPESWNEKENVVEKVCEKNRSLKISEGLKTNYQPLRRPKSDENILQSSPPRRLFPTFETLKFPLVAAVKPAEISQHAIDATAEAGSRCSKLTNTASSFDNFPSQKQSKEENYLHLAEQNPDQLPSNILDELARTIMKRVLKGLISPQAGAKLCITIADKENRHRFLESLIKISQTWYEDRDRVLREESANHFPVFMRFLTEMRLQLKQAAIKVHFEKRQTEIAAESVLLCILTKCCQACVGMPIKSVQEVECLFYVLTSIGMDLEMELPMQLQQLMERVRYGFLASSASAEIRRMLLQVIELKASSWQLSESTKSYYESKNQCK